MRARPTSGVARPSPIPRGVRRLIALVVVLGAVVVAYATVVALGLEVPWRHDASGSAGASAAERTDLDLELTYTATTYMGGTASAAALERAEKIVRRRITLMAITGATVTASRDGKLVVRLPSGSYGDEDMRVLDTIGIVRIFYDNQESRPVGPKYTREEVLQDLRGLDAFYDEIKMLREDGVGFEHMLVRYFPEETSGDHSVWWYVYRLPPAMTGGVRSAWAWTDDDGAPLVIMKFTRSGSARFDRICGVLYRRGIRERADQSCAIVLDDTLVGVISFSWGDKRLARGAHGYLTMAGGLSKRRAEDVAVIMRTGPLPVMLTLVSSQRVEASAASAGPEASVASSSAGTLALGRAAKLRGPGPSDTLYRLTARSGRSSS